jgi:hypothetical protein
MLTEVTKEEDGTIYAVKFIAENAEERQHLADGQEGFRKMTSTPESEHKEK